MYMGRYMGDTLSRSTGLVPSARGPLHPQQSEQSPKRNHHPLEWPTKPTWPNPTSGLSNQSPRIRNPRPTVSPAAAAHNWTQDQRRTFSSHLRHAHASTRPPLAVTPAAHGRRYAAPAETFGGHSRFASTTRSHAHGLAHHRNGLAAARRADRLRPREGPLRACRRRGDAPSRYHRPYILPYVEPAPSPP